MSTTDPVSRVRSYSCASCGIERSITPPDDIHTIATSTRPRIANLKQTTFQCENCHQPNTLYWYSPTREETPYLVDKKRFAEGIERAGFILCVSCGIANAHVISKEYGKGESEADLLLVCNGCRTVLAKITLTSAGLWRTQPKKRRHFFE